MRIVQRNPELGYLSENLSVPKRHVNVEGTKSALTFSTTVRGTKDKERFVCLWQETINHLIIPREFWSLSDLNFEVVDTRPRHYESVDFKSNIVLDAQHPGETVQQDALAAMMAARGGVLQLACGRGKTVVALELIARLGIPALVVVDNTQLMKQWREAIDQFLVVPGGVGLIQADVFDWKKSLVMATYHTLAARAENFPQEVRRWFGVTIWDEAHHIAAPTFSKSVDLFYGRRYGLTATPERNDGMHVVHNFHLGPTLYKNLSQELRPRIQFLWTAIRPDLTDPDVKRRVCDINGELHNSMLAGYFGQLKPRLDFIINEVREWAKQGRRILVLSYSINELVNLLCLWTGQNLYTDIPEPTLQELNEVVTPYRMLTKDLLKVQGRIPQLRRLLGDPNLNHVKAQHYKFELQNMEDRLKAHQVWVKMTKETERRRNVYLPTILSNSVGAGLMIGKIKPEARHKMLRESQVTFAIMKYGLEGLDEKALDTVAVCEPLSKKGGLQQLMGRTLRKKSGKMQPLVVFFEDDVGPMIGMCSHLRRHLRHWPADEGGPLAYENVGHVRKERSDIKWRNQ